MGLQAGAGVWPAAETGTSTHVQTRLSRLTLIDRLSLASFYHALTQSHANLAHAAESH